MSQTVDIKLSSEELEGTEATISQWLFKEGESIQQGEPIVELETDKVSMEICAPQSGILKQILVHTGEQVETDAVLGRLSTKVTQTNNETARQDKTIPQVASDITSAKAEDVSQTPAQTETKNGKSLLSPSVKRLLKENNISSEHINGTGKNGRVNRNDVMQFLSMGSSSSHELKGTLIPHTKIRKTIAKHMVESLLEVSPHVTSVFDMNMSNIIEHRKWHKKEYADEGVNLTFTAYFLAAIVKAVRQAPEVNARFHEEALEIFNDINIGVGTALGNNGLVVPVIKQVQSMSLFEIAEALTNQTAKAREGKLKPSDMKNGTFTISNHGVSGSLFAAPIIINQPEVAILGIGKLEKRVVVEEINQQDTIQIKPMCYVSLSIDHRALDAYQTSQFLSTFVETIETWGV